MCRMKASVGHNRGTTSRRPISIRLTVGYCPPHSVCHYVLFSPCTSLCFCENRSVLKEKLWARVRCVVNLGSPPSCGSDRSLVG